MSLWHGFKSETVAQSFLLASFTNCCIRCTKGLDTGAHTIRCRSFPRSDCNNFTGASSNSATMASISAAFRSFPSGISTVHVWESHSNPRDSHLVDQVSNFSAFQPFLPKIDSTATRAFSSARYNRSSTWGSISTMSSTQTNDQKLTQSNPIQYPIVFWSHRIALA